MLSQHFKTVFTLMRLSVLFLCFFFTFGATGCSGVLQLTSQWRKGDITIDGARGILFNVTGGPDLSLFEVNEAASIIKQTAHPDVNLIFGAVIDESMSEEIRITVIATGFDQTESRPRVARATFSEKVEFPAPAFDKDDLEIPAFLRRRG